MTDKPTALDLPMAKPLPEPTQKYFDTCKEKLGIVLAKSQVLLVGKEIDYTDQAIKELNKVLPKVKFEK